MGYLFRTMEYVGMPAEDSMDKAIDNYPP